MDFSIFAGLVNNAALLLALGLLYDVLAARRHASQSSFRPILSGLVLGAMTVAVMLNPWKMQEGVIFDTRSVMLCISGLFFGPLPTAIAVLMSGLFRCMQGGDGLWMGLGVIASSGGIGVLWRLWRRGRLHELGLGELYLFGLVVHLVMVIWMYVLPEPVFSHIMAFVAPSVLLIYPFGTAGLGRLMVSREQRRLNDEALQESESRYRSLFEDNHVPMLIIDPADGAIIDANPMACSWYGWDRQTMQRMNLGQINIKSTDDIRVELNDALYGRQNHLFLQHRLADGSARDVEVYKGPLQIGGRSVLYSIIIDITEQKRAQEELAASELRFRSLVEQAPIPIFIQFGDTFAYVNPAASSVFAATSAEELLGTPVVERFHPDFRKGLREQLQLLGSGQPVFASVEEECVRLDGSTFPAEISIVSFNYQGQDGALIFLQDTSERRKALEQRMEMERQILQSQKLESLGVLAGGIAHDFNNILMAVLGHADLAQMELPPDSPALKSIGEINKAARRAADLCRQMLAYSGRGHFVVGNIHFHPLLEEMLDLLKTTISKKAVLKLKLQDDLPSMRGDATQIRQVIMNLVINASESLGDEDGVITVATGSSHLNKDYLTLAAPNEDLKEGVYVWLEVTDTGCGMSKETMARIFEPFFTTKFTGRGLGMAAVMGIVRGHHGAVKIYSELGVGTTFKILPFPAASESADTRENERTPASDKWQGHGTVLLVDDEETVRSLGKRMLETLGFETLLAADGVEGVELYRRHHREICLVLLDLTMPRMSGDEALQEFRQINPTVPVILTSGYSESEISTRFLGEGATVIQKPYTLSHLRDRLRATLEMHLH